ncbi:hypothetical protein BDW62DRAFT_111672 [Aspergillus aurantiobrunneus]
MIRGMTKTGIMHAWEQEGIRGRISRLLARPLEQDSFLFLGFADQTIFDALSAGSGRLYHGHKYLEGTYYSTQTIGVCKRLGMCTDPLLRSQHRGSSNVTNLIEQVAWIDQVLESLLRGRSGRQGFILFWTVRFMLDQELKMAFWPEIIDFCGQLARQSWRRLFPRDAIVKRVILAEPAIE